MILRASAPLLAELHGVLGREKFAKHLAEDKGEDPQELTAETELLGEGLGMHVRFGPIYQLPPARRFGLAILSRTPIVEFTNHMIPRLSTQANETEPTLLPDLENYAEELWGIEDPRITFVPELGKYAIAYTAFSRDGPGVAPRVADEGDGLGPVELDLLYNLNQETLDLPAFALVAGADFTGAASAGAGWRCSTRCGRATGRPRSRCWTPAPGSTSAARATGARRCSAPC